jgi:indole-3-glycerol phosphate synthase
MSILDQIVASKKIEVAKRQELYPVKLLEQSKYYATPVVSLSKYLLDPEKTGIIAEIKKKSPSLGWINPYISVEQVSIGYMQAGASALSILTDQDYFGGSMADFEVGRKFNYCPILRKDFIIDPYQVIESKSIGADVLLLIAAILNDSQMLALFKLAHNIGLQVLFEVHTQEELERVLSLNPDFVGVNSRNLHTFNTSLDTLLSYIDLIPKHILAIAESGIETAADYHTLKSAGYKGFLMGTRFMRHSRPHDACREFSKQVKVSESAFNQIISKS